MIFFLNSWRLYLLWDTFAHSSSRKCNISCIIHTLLAIWDAVHQKIAFHRCPQSITLSKFMVQQLSAVSGFQITPHSLQADKLKSWRDFMKKKMSDSHYFFAFSVHFHHTLNCLHQVPPSDVLHLIIVLKTQWMYEGCKANISAAI